MFTIYFSSYLQQEDARYQASAGLPRVGGAENIDCSNIQRVPNKLFCQYPSSGALLLGLLQQLSNYGEAEMDDDGVLSVVIITKGGAERDKRDSQRRAGHQGLEHTSESFFRTIKGLSLVLIRADLRQRELASSGQWPISDTSWMMGDHHVSHVSNGVKWTVGSLWRGGPNMNITCRGRQTRSYQMMARRRLGLPRPVNDRSLVCRVRDGCGRM